MSLPIDRQIALGDHLAEYREPLLLVHALTDAEGAEPVVAQAPYFLVGLAAQYVDHMMGAEALAGAVDAGQRLAGGVGAVPGVRRIQTIVAVAQGLSEISPK